ncbi:hypothetical protein [Dyella sp.]|uniref:hypothetical protein n=1 Tax=Dyella sp. TaxID=1869338 RepID=UPI002F95AC24
MPAAGDINRITGQFYNDTYSSKKQTASEKTLQQLFRNQNPARIKNVNTPAGAFVVTLLPCALLLGSIHNVAYPQSSTRSTFPPGAAASSPNRQHDVEHNEGLQQGLLNAGAAGIGAGVAKIANGNTRCGLKLLAIGLTTGGAGLGIGYVASTYGRQVAPSIPDTPVASALDGCSFLCSVEEVDNAIQVLNNDLTSRNWKGDIEQFHDIKVQIVEVLSGIQNLIDAQEVPPNDANELSAKLAAIRVEHIDPYLIDFDNYAPLSLSTTTSLDLLQMNQVKKLVAGLSNSLYGMGARLNEIYLRYIG